MLYYYNKNKNDDARKKIVLLGTCDIPGECKKFLSDEEYKIAEEEATRLVNEGREDELIDFSVMANGKISAGTYYYDFLPNGETDFIRYSNQDSKSEIINSTGIPVLIVFGDMDECVLTQPIDVVKQYLINSIKNVKVQIISDADHSYTNKYKELGAVIKNNF